MASKHSTWHVVTVKPWYALGLAAVVALATACEAKVANGSTNGSSIYQSVCSPCHGINGKPSAANIARLGVRDLTSPEFRARVTPAVVEHQVRKGSQNKLMPAFEGALSEEQIKSISHYVASQQFMWLSGGY